MVKFPKISNVSGGFFENVDKIMHKTFRIFKFAGMVQPYKS